MTVGPTHPIMSLQARIKNLERVMDEAGDVIEGLIEVAEAYEKRAHELQERLTVMEEKLKFYELETGSINYYLAERSRISAPD